MAKKATLDGAEHEVEDVQRSEEPIGRIHGLWRYPVKSMAGEAVDRMFVGFNGVMGDRMFAFVDTDSSSHFPWITGRNFPDIVRYRVRFLNPSATVAPQQVDQALKGPTGVLPPFPTPDAFEAEVESVDGKIFKIGDPALCRHLSDKTGRPVAVRYGLRSMADCRPVSIISAKAPGQLAQELGRDVDMRRFRMNLIVEWQDGLGPAQDIDLVGKTLRVGRQLQLAVTDPDWRCKMIAIDPDTAELDQAIPRHVARTRSGALGVYAAVLREGMVGVGDPIFLV